MAGQVQVVGDGPVLDDQGVLEAEDVDLAEGDGLAGWGQAQEGVGVAAMEGAGRGHGVVVGDELVGLPAPLRGLGNCMDLAVASRPGRSATREVVVDEVGVEDLGEDGEVAMGEDRFQGPAGGRFEVLG